MIFRSNRPVNLELLHEELRAVPGLVTGEAPLLEFHYQIVVFESHIEVTSPVDVSSVLRSHTHTGVSQAEKDRIARQAELATLRTKMEGLGLTPRETGLIREL